MQPDAESALKDVLEKVNLSYKKIGNYNYVIKWAPAARANKKAAPTQILSSSFTTAVVANIILTGTVTSSEKGEVLPGVSIKLKGTTIGDVTDAEGKFSLSVPETNASGTLVATYVGFLEKEVAINGQQVINISLTPNTRTLDEVVVVGYGTQRKSDVTGSLSQVKSQELNAYPVINAVQGIQGKAAGVQVIQNSGEPGKNISVRIRGGNSLRGSNEPLYVVDGFALADKPNALNPADIESIEILKDASSTAIYGSRGANGVVLITSKKGKAGRSNVSIDSYYGVQRIIKKLNLLNARQFTEIANQRAANDGLAPYFTPAEVESFGDGTDWQDELFRTAPIQNHVLSFSGGSDKTQYSVSASYFAQQGIILGSDFNRASVRANINHKVSDKLSLFYNSILSRTGRSLINSDNGQRGNSVLSGVFAAPPTISPYNANGTYSNVTAYAFSPNALQNPLELALARKNTIKENYIFSNLNLNYEPVKDLFLKVSFGIENNPSREDFYSPRIIASSPTGTASLTFVDQYNILNENILNYSKKFKDKHSFNFTGGVTYQHQKTQNSSSGASGFATDVLQNNALASGSSPSVPTSSTSEYTLASYLGRINYSYKNRYLFTVSDRADGSSRFGKSNKWGNFPSAAVAWHIKEENFLKNNKVISDLKIRTSWGKTGSTAVTPYQTLNTLNDVQTVFNEQLYIGFAPGAILANPNLKWETTTQANVGVDLGLLKNRVQVTLDLYNKNTSDLLAVVPLAPSYGYTSTIQNIGEIRNRGVELGVNGAILTGPLRWNANANISANRNKVIRLAGNSDVMGAALGQPIGASVNLVRVGYPVGVFYGYLENELDDKGQIKYKDLDNNNVINANDKTVIGDPNPDFIYGFSSNMSFKNFDFNFFVQGVKGADIFNYNKSGSASSFYFGENQIADLYNNAWTPQNPNPQAKYPKISSGTLFKESDRYVEDGSYLRLKNIQLAYNIRSSKATSWIKNVQLYLSGQNLLTLTKYTWYDPEISSRGGANSISLGIDQTGFPNAKTVTIGTRMNF